MIPGAGREQSPERPLVTPKEVARLAATVEPRWSALVLLAAWGALRFGELQRLARADVDLLHGTLEVRQAKTRAGVRTVHLPAPMVAVLGALSKNFVRRDFRDAADALGLTALTFHDLRHFSGTQTAISGATLREIQARLRHASPAAALRYQHAAASRAAQVAEALGAAWVEPTQAPNTVRNIRRA